MSVDLDILTFRGHDISVASGTYRGYTTVSSGGMPNTFGAQSVEIVRPGRFPKHARVQPQSSQFPIEIQVLNPTRENWNQLQQWFDPLDGEGYLIAQDRIGNPPIRIACVPELFALTEANVCKISLKASEGTWESVDETDTSFDEGGGTLVNEGTTRTYPVFNITPPSAKAADVSWPHKRRLLLANRSPYALGDPLGDGYPILLLDLASISLSAGDDIRVILKNEEHYSYFGGTKLWANLNFRSGLSFTNEASFSSSVPGEGDPFVLSNDTGATGFDTDDEFTYVMAGTEAIRIRIDGPFQATVMERGALGTTAASHSEDTVWWWIEHPTLTLIYGYTGAAAAVRPPVRQPIINLEDSTNILRIYDSGFFNQDDIKSGAWQTALDEQGVNMRIRNDSGHIIFENLGPTDAMPNYNNVILDFPVPIIAGAGTISMAGSIDAALVSQVFVTDIRGNESIARKDTVGSATYLVNPGLAIIQIRIQVMNGVAAGYSAPPNGGGTGNYGILTGSVFRTVRVQAQNPQWIPYTPDVPDPDHEMTLNARIQVDLHTEIDFILPQDTAIDSVSLKISGFPSNTNLHGAVWTEAYDKLITAFDWNTGSTGSGWVTFAGANQVLPAGTYRMVFPLSPSGSIVAFNATRPDMALINNGIDPQEIAAIVTGHTRPEWSPGVWLSDGSDRPFTSFDVLALIYAPFSAPQPSGLTPMMVIIATTKSDGTPIDNSTTVPSGGKVDYASMTFHLDPDLAPMIYVGPQTGLYLIDGAIQSSETDDAIAMFVLMTPGETLQIDCINGRAWDMETGLTALTGITPSNPDEFIFLKPGNNAITWQETSTEDVAIAVTHNDRWLG